MAPTATPAVATANALLGDAFMAPLGKDAVQAERAGKTRESQGGKTTRARLQRV